MFEVSKATIEAHGEQVLSLLHLVYVGEGYTRAEVARERFTAEGVFARGELLIAQNLPYKAVLGVIILVPPTSKATQLASENEAEIHLLAVHPDHRQHGVGNLLMTSVIQAAQGYEKIILWTQPTMTDAHRLYDRCGFERAPARDFDREGIKFMVYELNLT
jgi:ribosomal protein S18 acetylase RimI-like enzyme